MLVWRKVINLGDSAVGLSGADGARCSNWVSQGWLHWVMGPSLAVIMQLTPSWENGKYIVQNIHFSMQSVRALVLSTPFHSIAWQILSNTIFKKTSAKSRLVLSSHKKVALTDCYWLFFSPMAKLPLSPRLSLFITAWTKLLHFFCLNNLWSDCDMAIVSGDGAGPRAPDWPDILRLDTIVGNCINLSLKQLQQLSAQSNAASNLARLLATMLTMLV